MKRMLAVASNKRRWTSRTPALSGMPPSAPLSRPASRRPSGRCRTSLASGGEKGPASPASMPSSSASSSTSATRFEEGAG